MSDLDVVTDDRFPGWRARIVYDPHPDEPWGDALAPALLAWRGQRAEFAKEVFVPAGRADILQAFDHYADRQLFERYLRIVHGVTTIATAEGHEITVWIFDTADYRAHVGHTGPISLDGERTEWLSYLDGDVFGVIVEQHHSGTTCWDDGRVEQVQQWRDIDSLWGLYGHDYATETAVELLTQTAH